MPRRSLDQTEHKLPQSKSSSVTCGFHRTEKMKTLKSTNHRLSLPDFGGGHRLLKQTSCASPLDELMSDINDVRLTSYLSLGIQKLVADLQLSSPQHSNKCADDLSDNQADDLQCPPGSLQRSLSTETLMFEERKQDLALVPPNLCSHLKLSSTETVKDNKKNKRKIYILIAILRSRVISARSV